jgi:hypothetical protein
MISVDDSFFELYERNRNIDLSKQDVERAGLVSRLVELAKTRPDLPMILPRRVDSETHWYFLARTPKQARLMRDQIRAFLGPPLWKFEGGRGTLITGDHFDSYVESLFGDSFLKVTVGTNQVVRKCVNTAIGELADLLTQMPTSSFDLTRPLQRVLSDFEWSLQMRDAEASRHFLEEISTNGRLSQENILFLRVRRLAVFELWAELLALEELGDLLRLRMPNGILFAVIRAVDQEILCIEDDDERSCRLASERLSALSSLKIGQENDAPSDVRKAFHRLRRSFGLEDPRDGDADNRSVTKIHIAEGSNDVSELQPQRQSDDPVGPDDLENLLVLGQYETVFEKCFKLDQSMRRTGILLRAAFEDRSPEVLDRVLSDSSSWPDSVRREVEASHLLRKIFEWIESQALDGVVPKSLLDWLLTFESDLPDHKLQMVFDQQRENWLLRPIDRDSMIQLASIIEEITLGPRSQLLRRNLAFVHEVAVGYGESEKVSVLEASFNVLALEDDLSPTELIVLHNLAESVLEVAEPETRKRVMSELCEIWERIASPNRLTWALDVAATVRATARVQDEQSRVALERLAARVAAFMPASVDPNLVPLIRLFLGDAFDFDACRHIFILAPEQSIEDDPLKRVAGKKIGLYTTEHRRAQRIRDAVLKLVNCDVRLNHDLRCSDQLAALSKQCDIVVVLTNAATHSATECITSHRGHGPTWLIHASGTSSVLAKIGQHLLNWTP